MRIGVRGGAFGWVSGGPLPGGVSEKTKVAKCPRVCVIRASELLLIDASEGTGLPRGSLPCFNPWQAASASTPQSRPAIKHVAAATSV